VDGGSSEGNLTVGGEVNNEGRGGAGSWAAQGVAVRVNPAAEAPVLTLGSTTATVTEGSTVTLPSVTASGVDGDDTVTVTIAGLRAGERRAGKEGRTGCSGSGLHTNAGGRERKVAQP